MANTGAITLILIWSVLVPLTIPRLGPGQTITVTNVQYSVASSIITYSTNQTTATSTQVVSYERTPYDYSYETNTFSFWQTEFISRPTGSDVPCLFYDYFQLNATTGQEFRGQFTLLVPGRSIHFFILNQDQLRRFNSHNCAYGWDGSSELDVFASSYDLDWVVPTGGVYTLLFLSTTFYGGYIHFSMQEYSTSVRNQTITYATPITLILQTNHTLVSTLPNMNLQSSSTGYLVALTVIVIVGLTISILVIKGKHS